jgi:hypothetical protein
MFDPALVPRLRRATLGLLALHAAALALAAAAGMRALRRRSPKRQGAGDAETVARATKRPFRAED